MPEPVLSQVTSQTVERLLAHPPHALLLVAPEGFGKRTIADILAARLLGHTSAEQLRENAAYHITQPEKTGVTIEAVRQLQHFAKLKAAGQGIQRVAVIEQAHTMSGEAQNAALKLLEEPPAGMVLLLTAATEQALLPTIRSRVQMVRLVPSTRQQLLDHFSAQAYETSVVERAALLSGGLPGLMGALLDAADHPLTGTVEQARGLLRASVLERLGQVDAAAKNREDAARLCAMLQRMAAAALESAAAKQTLPAIRQWHRIRQAGFEAEAALRGNAQPKLVMTNLMLSL